MRCNVSVVLCLFFIEGSCNENEEEENRREDECEERSEITDEFYNLTKLAEAASHLLGANKVNAIK